MRDISSAPSADDGGEREQELAVRQRVIGAIAEHHGRKQVGAAFVRDQTRPAPIACRHVDRSRRLESGVNLL